MLPVILASLIKFGLSTVAGAVASSGKELVEKKLGINLDDALGTEEGRIKLKGLEYTHEEFLINAAQTTDARDLDYFKAEVADRGDARNREIEMEKLRAAPYWFPSTVTVLTFLIVSGCGWLFATISDDSTKLVLVSIVTMVLQFYYGTTKSSSTKDSTIAQMAKEAGK